MRTRIPINTTLDPEVVQELDAWLDQQPVRIKRAAFIEAAIKRMLADEKAKSKRGVK